MQQSWAHTDTDLPIYLMMPACLKPGQYYKYAIKLHVCVLVLSFGTLLLNNLNNVNAIAYEDYDLSSKC